MMATDVTLPHSMGLKTSETCTLSVVDSPFNASDKSVVWSTSETNVVTVNNGLVTAVDLLL